MVLGPVPSTQSYKLDSMLGSYLKLEPLKTLNVMTTSITTYSYLWEILILTLNKTKTRQTIPIWDLSRDQSEMFFNLMVIGPF